MDDLYSRLELTLLPKITDAQIREMLKVMNPIKEVEEYRYRLMDIKGIHPRDFAYTWSEKPLGRPLKLHKHGALESRCILTYHGFGFHGFFKPSLAEVLACIRRDVKNWELIRYFHVEAIDTDQKIFMPMVNSGVHVGLCRLFGEEPDGKNWHSSMHEDFAKFEARCRVADGRAARAAKKQKETGEG